MIFDPANEWWSFRASVGEEVEVPNRATDVTILPIESESDTVMVTVFDCEEAESEPEARHVRKETFEKGEPYHGAFHHYPTAVPSPSGESVTVYYLGRTEEERYTL